MLAPQSGRLLLLRNDSTRGYVSLNISQSPSFFKIALFEFEVPWMETETAIYQAIDGHGIGPAFLGHLVEHMSAFRLRVTPNLIHFSKNLLALDSFIASSFFVVLRIIVTMDIHQGQRILFSRDIVTIERKFTSL